MHRVCVTFSCMMYNRNTSSLEPIRGSLKGLRGAVARDGVFMLVHPHSERRKESDIVMWQRTAQLRDFGRGYDA